MRTRRVSPDPSPARPSWGHLVMLLLTITVLAGADGPGARQLAQPAGPGPVHVIPIDAQIDRGTAPFLDRALSAAQDDEAAAAVIVLDTPGGRLDAVLEMRDTLLGSPVHTIAFVDSTAFSAGALVALAADEIWFDPAGVMGAATPVTASPAAAGGAETADPKVVSAVRSTFRATALEHGRDPLIAEAMVDTDVEVPGLVESGALLTLDAEQAAANGYSEGEAADLDALLEDVGLADRTVVAAAPAPFERIVSLITRPTIASVLLSAGTLLVIGSVVAGTFGTAALTGLALLAAFFYGHLLAGLAGWEDAALVVVGLVLIGVEVLVLPGFGIAGALGLAGVLGGGYLAMIGRGFEFVTGAELVSTGATILVTFAVVTIALLVVLSLLGRRSNDGRRHRGWLGWFGDGGVLAAEDQRPSADVGRDEATGGGLPHDAPAHVASEGAVGVAVSDLHPAGIAEFDGHRVDVVSEGGYLDAGARIEVVRAERYRKVVRAVRG